MPSCWLPETLEVPSRWWPNPCQTCYATRIAIPFVRSRIISHQVLPTDSCYNLLPNMAVHQWCWHHDITQLTNHQRIGCKVVASTAGLRPATLYMLWKVYFCGEVTFAIMKKLMSFISSRSWTKSVSFSIWQSHHIIKVGYMRNSADGHKLTGSYS